MKKQIEEARLTLVFQEAVRLTRYLKVRFLWIDALCIVQDSKEDSAAEAATMASVYENATLTIATAGSPDSHTSFLRPREESPGVWLPGFKVGNGPGEQLLLCPSIQYLQVMEKHLKEPLQTRAWCFQERILSRRTIYFDTEQFLFECHRGTFPESSAGQQDLRNYNASGRTMLPYTKLDQVLKSGKQDLQVRSVEMDSRSHWYSLLNEYCQRKLTYPGDILPAFSGVAKHFSTLTGDTYLAGIWQQHIHMGLLWEFQSWEEPNNLKRSEFAPTWSWASVWASQGRLQPSVVKHYNTHRKPTDRDAILLKAELDPFHGDMTGQLRSGVLHISGLCRQVHLTLKEKTNIRERHGLDLLDTISGLKASGWIDGDNDLEDLLEETAEQKWTLKMTSLLLSQWDIKYHSTIAMLHGLLLTTSKGGRYVRRGTFRIEAPLLVGVEFQEAQKAVRPAHGPAMSRNSPRKDNLDGTWEGWERKTVMIE